MISLKKHWKVFPPIPPKIAQNLQDFPPLLRQILYNRGYCTPQEAWDYLKALPPPEADPFNLKGMEQAVERIHWAIQRQEPIAIYGDYDVDGVTGTALLSQVLSELGANVKAYIPNRFDEGYGVNNDALDSLYQDGVRLVITVDCGVRSVDEAEHARHLGLDLIITDHHTPHAQLPQACAVIDPKQPSDPYPDKNLSGVGLAYKLASALYGYRSYEALELEDSLPIQEHLDLVALGTVADIVPLTGENRFLVRAGLQGLRQPHRQGVMALIGASGLSPERVTSTDISFVLGPRLNAAGRLDTAFTSLRLLQTSDFIEAGLLAQQLNIQNRERQDIMRQIEQHAEQAILAEDPAASLFFAVHESYNPGVVGLAASRLTEKYYRPTVIASQGEELTRGSCRSIPEFNITHALDQCSDILIHHGGHSAAAGFTVHNRDLPELRHRLKEIASQALSAFDLRPTLSADAQVELSELRPDLLRELQWLEPTGFGNRQATFVSRNLKVTRSRAVGREGSHLKLTLTDGYLTFDGIMFRSGHLVSEIPNYVDILYVFETNEYNGTAVLQLNIRDLKPAGMPD